MPSFSANYSIPFVCACVCLTRVVMSHFRHPRTFHAIAILFHEPPPTSQVQNIVILQKILDLRACRSSPLIRGVPAPFLPITLHNGKERSKISMAAPALALACCNVFSTSASLPCTQAHRVRVSSGYVHARAIVLFSRCGAKKANVRM